MLIQHKFEYNDEFHEYKIDGVIVPSVTQILSANNLNIFNIIPDKILKNAEKYNISLDILKKLYFVLDDEVLNNCSNFGDAGHKTCELYDNNELDESILDPNLKPVLEAWKKFKKDFKVEIIDNEKQIYSPKYMFAGTRDKKALINKKLSILEIKTTTTINKVLTGIQTGGYQILEKEKGEKACKRFCIQLGIINKETKKVTNNYKVIPLNNKQDKENFLHCLAVYNLKKSLKII